LFKLGSQVYSQIQWNANFIRQFKSSYFHIEISTPLEKAHISKFYNHKTQSRLCIDCVSTCFCMVEAIIKHTHYSAEHLVKHTCILQTFTYNNTYSKKHLSTWHETVPQHRIGNLSTLTWGSRVKFFPSTSWNKNLYHCKSNSLSESNKRNPSSLMLV
jgi:hypothetical protein